MSCSTQTLDLNYFNYNDFLLTLETEEASSDSKTELSVAGSPANSSAETQAKSLGTSMGTN